MKELTIAITIKVPDNFNSFDTLEDNQMDLQYFERGCAEAVLNLAINYINGVDTAYTKTSIGEGG
jgi:hypothetical protein